MHMKMSDGIGVKQLTLINEMAAGKWPFRAPTKNNRDDAKMAPFNEPNVEQATNNGITQAKNPNILLANVTYSMWQKEKLRHFKVLCNLGRIILRIREKTKLIKTYGDRIGRDNFIRCEDCKISDICYHINGCHNGHTDANCTWQIPEIDREHQQTFMQ